MIDTPAIPACPNPPFAEFKVGQRVEFESRFGAAEIDSFAELSGDWNPLHVDDAYAARSPFRKRVAHGMLVSSLLSRVAGMYFPGQQSLLLQVEQISFPGPVLEDEPLRCEAELIEVHAVLQILVVEAKVFGRYNKLKLTGRIKVQYRAPAKATPALPSLEELMQTDLSNHVALITGASRGIGAAIAEALGRCHAKVVLNYHTSATQAEEAAQRIINAGGEAIALKGNVTQRAEMTALIKQAQSKFGAIDLLVHNATAPLEDLAFADTPWELMLRDFEIHVGGAFHCLQEVLPGMVQKKFGRIVTILTVTLDTPPPKGYTAYVTAKSGLMGLTRSIASEYGRFGITANMVSPGMVETDLTAHLDDRAKKMVAMRIPAGRIANPADVVGPVMFLLSPATEYMNGAVLNVNGGMQF